jgi:hypothetical protein
MRKTIIALGMLAVFLAAGLAPAMAEPEKADKNDKSEKAADASKKPAVAFEAKRLRVVRANTTLELSGTAVDADNNTYAFELSAKGKTIVRGKGEDGFRALYGRLAAHGTLTDAEGKVVKEGDFRIHLRAVRTDEGWKWAVTHFAARDAGLPRLVVRGDAERIDAGEFDVEGRGHAVVRLDGSESATPMRLRDVVGSFTRDAPPAATFAAAPGPEPAPSEAADSPAAK